MDATRISTKALIAAGIAVGGTALALAGYSASSADQQPAGTPATDALPASVAALTRAATAADTVPAELLDLPVAERFNEATLKAARAIGSHAGRTYWVVPGLRDELCFVATSGSAETFESAGTCNERTQLSQGAIWFSETAASGNQAVSLLLPDGIKTADSGDGRAATVENNLAVLEVTPSQDTTITLTDVSGKSVSLPLGELTAPE